MTDKIDCEVFVAMNEDGDWVADADNSDTVAALIENYGGCQVRVVKITVSMSPPEMSEAKVTVPDEAGSVSAQSEAV